MNKFSIGSWFGKAVNGVAAFSKKNAPSIITGGSILLGWAAVGVFWKQSRNADIAIKHKEEELRKSMDIPEDQAGEVHLETKEKALIYLQYCWVSLLMGLGSTGLAIFAHKMDLTRLAQMYMLTQMLEDKNADQQNLIDKLKGEVSEKKFRELDEQVVEERFPEKTAYDGPIEDTGRGPTLFIPDFGGIKFESSITDVTRGIYDFREMVHERRERLVKSKLSDPFFVTSDNPYHDMDIYASEDVDEFFRMLGVKQKINAGDILEFRDYGDKDFMDVNAIMDYKKYVNPATGVPAVCILRIRDLLRPTNELLERDPR